MAIMSRLSIGNSANMFSRVRRRSAFVMANVFGMLIPVMSSLQCRPPPPIGCMATTRLNTSAAPTLYWTIEAEPRKQIKWGGCSPVVFPCLLVGPPRALAALNTVIVHGCSSQKICPPKPASFLLTDICFNVTGFSSTALACHILLFMRVCVWVCVCVCVCVSRSHWVVCGTTFTFVSCIHLCNPSSILFQNAMVPLLAIRVGCIKSHPLILLLRYLLKFFSQLMASMIVATLFHIICPGNRGRWNSGVSAMRPSVNWQTNASRCFFIIVSSKDSMCKSAGYLFLRPYWNLTLF